MDSDTLIRLGYLGLLLLAVSGWLLVEYRGRLGQAMRAAAAWGLIFLGVLAGYGLWHDIRTDIAPRQSVLETGEIRLPRAADGHYYAQLLIGGTSVQFLIDTGATQTALARSDAKRLGINPETLLYLGEARTANGTIRTARVTLENVTLGPYHDQELQATIGDGALDTSLLGMSYLGKYHITIAGDEMILRR